MPDEPLPPPPPPVKKKTWWQNVVSELVDLVEAIIEFTADPVVAKRIISDLGVDVSGPIPNANIPMTEVQNLREYAENTDVTAEAFAATVEQAAAIVEALITFVKSLDGDLTEEEAFDLLLKLTGTFTTETVKARHPTLYWMMKSLALFSEQFGNVERFDLDAFGSLFNSEADDGTPGFTEFEATRWSDLFTFAVQQVLGNVVAKLGPGHSESDFQWLDSYYGWETPPEHAGRVDVGVLERMWTIRIKSGPGQVDSSVAITIALVPIEHGGPGFFVSIGGGIGLTREINDNILSISTALDGGLNFFIYTGDDGSDTFQSALNGDAEQAIDVSYRPKEAEFPIEVDPIFRWDPEACHRTARPSW